MESSRRPRARFRHALAAVAVGALTIGSLALLPPQVPSSAVWQFTRIAGPSTTRAGLSAERPGHVAVIRFSLGAFRGPDIFLHGAPVSAQIDCAGRPSSEEGAPPDSTTQGALAYDAEREIYTYLWVTPGTWEGTCRRLSLGFADGSVHDVLVWFGDPYGAVAQASRRT
jgi:hypothetical protein